MDEKVTERNQTAPRPGEMPRARGGSYLPATIVFVILTLMLSVVLWVKHTAFIKEKTEANERFNQLSNQFLQVTADLNEAKQVITVKETDLDARENALKRLSTTLTQTTATLVKTEAEARKAAQQAAEEMAKRDQRIGELESQRDDLTKRMTELNGAISGLEGEIAETQRKLASSEGDRAFLLKELKRMQTEKMELEKQFNDLAMLRDQVKKLGEELSISKRLDWLRKGFYGTPKAAEKLQKPLTGTNRNYDLNVELKQDGSVKVNPGATNTPPK